jgi:hypothetical protein
MFFNRGIIGLRPTQGIKNTSSGATLYGHYPFLVIPTGAKRSGGTRGSSILQLLLILCPRSPSPAPSAWARYWAPGPAKPYTSQPDLRCCPAKAPCGEDDLRWLASSLHCPETTDTHPDRASPPIDTRSNPPHIHRQEYVTGICDNRNM